MRCGCIVLNIPVPGVGAYPRFHFYVAARCYVAMDLASIGSGAWIPEDDYNNFPCHLSFRTNKQTYGPFARSNCTLPYYRAENVNHLSALIYFEKNVRIRQDNGIDLFDGFLSEKYLYQRADDFIGFYVNSNGSDPIEFEFRIGFSVILFKTIYISI